jgi:hypothetical protein
MRTIAKGYAAREGPRVRCVATLALFFASAVSVRAAAQQNLLTNGGFASDIAGWSQGGGATYAWSALDANGSTTSGSASVTSTFPLGNVSTGLYQCLAVSPGQSYFLSSRARLPAGQASNGYVFTALTFNSEPGCNSASYLNAGTLSLTGPTTADGPFDTWRTVAASTVAPPGSRSAIVTIEIVKAEAGGSLQAFFDDVVLDVVAVSAPKTLVVPSAASIHGQNQTFFHTDLWVKNRSHTKSIVITAAYRCQAAFTCAGDASTTLSLAPRESRLLEDVVVEAFQRAETAGAIELAWDSVLGEVSAATRTYTPALPAPTNGTSVPASEASAAMTSALFLGLGNNGGDRTSGFRSNAGAYNRGAAPVVVTFRLIDASGILLGETTRTAEPGRPIQINDVFAAVAAGSAVTRDASLEVTSTLPVFPFVTVIDNQSGDSIWVVPSPDEAPEASPSP